MLSSPFSASALGPCAPQMGRTARARVAELRGARVVVADAQVRVLASRGDGRMADDALLVERVGFAGRLQAFRSFPCVSCSCPGAMRPTHTRRA